MDKRASVAVFGSTLAPKIPGCVDGSQGKTSSPRCASQAAFLTALKSVSRVRWMANRSFWPRTKAGYSKYSSPPRVHIVALRGSAASAFGAGDSACGFCEHAARIPAAKIIVIFFTGDLPHLLLALHPQLAPVR